MVRSKLVVYSLCGCIQCTTAVEDTLKRKNEVSVASERRGEAGYLQAGWSKLSKVSKC